MRRSLGLRGRRITKAVDIMAPVALGMDDADQRTECQILLHGNAEQRRQCKAAEGGVGGRPGLPQQLRPVGPQHRQHITGRRDLIGRNAEQSDREIPGHHDEDQEQKRPQPPCVQRSGYTAGPLRLGHVPLPDVFLGRN